jgi:hypothetical protein
MYENAIQVKVIDFTEKPDYEYFDEFRECLTPQIFSGKVANGELLDIKYKKMSVPNKWIREINEVAKELRARASKNIKLTGDKDKGDIPKTYANMFINAARIFPPNCVSNIERIYSCIGNITKIDLATIAMVYKSYFDAMDKDLLSAIVELSAANYTFENSLDHIFPIARFTSLNPLENLMADKILDAAHLPFGKWKSLDRYIKDIERYGESSLSKSDKEDYEELKTEVDNLNCYFNKHTFIKQYELLLYCITMTSGKRGFIGEDKDETYIKSLFAEFNIPYKLDTIPFL